MSRVFRHTGRLGDKVDLSIIGVQRRIPEDDYGDTSHVTLRSGDRRSISRNEQVAVKNLGYITE